MITRLTYLLSSTCNTYRHHPDRNNGSAESTEKFKEISQAYTILSDTAKRRSYDTSLESPITHVSTNTTSSPSAYYSPGRSSRGMRDAFQQFDDLFRNDPFFQEGFQDMDDAFAKRFNINKHDDETNSTVEDDSSGVGPVPFCGMGSPSRQNNVVAKPKVSWGQWLINKLGIEISVTSVSHNADGSVMKSAYTSKKTGYTNKKSRTYTESNGRQVTVMSMEKDGNKIEDKLVAGKLVERKVNGMVEILPSDTKKEIPW